MRRRDREICGIDEILGIVERCRVMRIAFPGNTPYIVPLNYGYAMNDGKLRLYFHSAREGRKAGLLRSSDTVAFEMDRLEDFVTSEIPCKWTAMYESAVGTARPVLLSEADEKARGMDSIMAHCGFLGKPDYQGRLDSVDVWALDVLTMTGKSSIPRRVQSEK